MNHLSNAGLGFVRKHARLTSNNLVCFKHLSFSSAAYFVYAIATEIKEGRALPYIQFPTHLQIFISLTLEVRCGNIMEHGERARDRKVDESFQPLSIEEVPFIESC
jgi:hypothetical protein